MPLSIEGKGKLFDGVKELGIVAPHGAIESLCCYLDLIEDWNTRINLTRILGDEAVTLHFLDALSLVKVKPLHEVDSLADIGTGLGVPGIVLKIFFPQMSLLLVDSLKKRVTFLEAAIKALGLSNTTAVHARSEELGNMPEYREKFSLVTARAVADLRVLAELCIPLCKIGGTFAAYKGDISPDELTGAHTRITEMGGDGHVQAKRITVPFLEAERTIVIVNKISKTPRNFPRAYRLIERG